MAKHTQCERLIHTNHSRITVDIMNIKLVEHILQASALIGLIFSAPVYAASVSFNFSAIADGDSSYGVEGREQGASSLIFTKNGISVTTTGFNTITPSIDYFAYLDAGNAGLGVCQQLNGDNDQCKIGSDDNVTYNESLKLVFNEQVTINETVFKNGAHGTNFDGDFLLSIDGGPAMTIALTNIFSTPITGQEFIFSNPNVGGGSHVSNSQQFYISNLDVAPVPIPAAVWLFGSGLIGIIRLKNKNS